MSKVLVLDWDWYIWYPRSLERGVLRAAGLFDCIGFWLRLAFCMLFPFHVAARQRQFLTATSLIRLSDVRISNAASAWRQEDTEFAGNH